MLTQGQEPSALKIQGSLGGFPGTRKLLAARQPPEGTVLRSPLEPPEGSPSGCQLWCRPPCPSESLCPHIRGLILSPGLDIRSGVCGGGVLQATSSLGPGTQTLWLHWVWGDQATSHVRKPTLGIYKPFSTLTSQDSESCPQQVRACTRGQPVALSGAWPHR